MAAYRPPGVVDKSIKEPDVQSDLYNKLVRIRLTKQKKIGNRTVLPGRKGDYRTADCLKKPQYYSSDR